MIFDDAVHFLVFFFYKTPPPSMRLKPLISLQPLLLIQLFEKSQQRNGKSVFSQVISTGFFAVAAAKQRKNFYNDRGGINFDPPSGNGFDSYYLDNPFMLFIGGFAAIAVYELIVHVLANYSPLQAYSNKKKRIDEFTIFAFFVAKKYVLYDSSSKNGVFIFNFVHFYLVLQDTLINLINLIKYKPPQNSATSGRSTNDQYVNTSLRSLVVYIERLIKAAHHFLSEFQGYFIQIFSFACTNLLFLIDAKVLFTTIFIFDVIFFAIKIIRTSRDKKPPN